ncbi:MAG: patatin-like phospholipase family protein [Anaerovoracaceae bacterium]|jgi:NTE family protein
MSEASTLRQTPAAGPQRDTASGREPAAEQCGSADSPDRAALDEAVRAAVARRADESEVLRCLRESSRPALVLSGGGSRGSYQCGVWQALRDVDLQPAIITGSSVGALNGAMMLTGHFDAARNFWENAETEQLFRLQTPTELRQKLASGLHNLSSMEHIFGSARSLATRGLLETDGLMQVLHQYIDEELVRSRSRQLNVRFGLSVTEIEGLRGHLLTLEDIPDGRLHDYLVASASCFPAARSHEIDGVRYVDGGYTDNLPVRMALDLGADAVLAVDLQAVGRVHQADLSSAPDLIHLVPSRDLGNFLVFEAETCRRNLLLGRLDTLKTLEILEGEQYAFRPGTFRTHSAAAASLLKQKHEEAARSQSGGGDAPELSEKERNAMTMAAIHRAHLRQAEAAGKIFGADPLRIYDADSFARAIRDQVLEASLVLQSLHDQHGGGEGGELGSALRHIRDLVEDLTPAGTAGLRKTIDMIRERGDDVLTVFIAEDIARRGSDSIFLQRFVLRLLNLSRSLKQHIDAAGYLIREGRVGEHRNR